MSKQDAGVAAWDTTDPHASSATSESEGQSQGGSTEHCIDSHYPASFLYNSSFTLPASPDGSPLHFPKLNSAHYPGDVNYFKHFPLKFLTMSKL